MDKTKLDQYVSPSARQKLDSTVGVGTGYFFARQLEQIMPGVIEKRLSPLNGLRLFRIDSSVNEGAESYTRRMQEYVGEADFISDFASDLPEADVNRREMSYRCHSIGDKYSYSMQEIRAAQFTGDSLQADKGLAARRMIEEKHNRICWYGDAKRGLYGVLTFPYTPRVVLSNPINVSSAAADIYAELAAFISDIRERTQQTEHGSRLILPQAEWDYIHNTRLTPGQDKTISAYLLANVKGLSVIESANELAPDSGDSRNPLTSRLIMVDNPELATFTYEMPMPFTQHAAQERNLSFIVPCESRTGGVYSEFPYSAAIGELPA